MTIIKSNMSNDGSLEKKRHSITKTEITDIIMHIDEHTKTDKGFFIAFTLEIFRLLDWTYYTKEEKRRCPYKYKYDLVDWATKYFNVPKARFNKMNKKQLYAIWYKIANKL